MSSTNLKAALWVSEPCLCVIREMLTSRGFPASTCKIRALWTSFKARAGNWCRKAFSQQSVCSLGLDLVRFRAWEWGWGLWEGRGPLLSTLRKPWSPTSPGGWMPAGSERVNGGSSVPGSLPSFPRERAGTSSLLFRGRGGRGLHWQGWEGGVVVLGVFSQAAGLLQGRDDVEGGAGRPARAGL